jgi:hypothetical protein
MCGTLTIFGTPANANRFTQIAEVTLLNGRGQCFTYMAKIAVEIAF